VQLVDGTMRENPLNKPEIKRFFYLDQHKIYRTVHLCSDHERMMRDTTLLIPLESLQKDYCDACKKGWPRDNRIR
jgi:hypothetical protein